MNGNNAGGVILGSMTAAVVMTTVYDLTTKHKTARAPAAMIPLGGIVATMILLGVANVAPEPAAMFAVLVLLATLAGPPGTQALSVVNTVLGSKPSPTVRNYDLQQVKGPQ